MRFQYVTVSDADVDDYHENGRYLIIDTENSGVPEEAQVIATTVDAVHARTIVAQMQHGHETGSV
jgi:hypothetical protein